MGTGLGPILARAFLKDEDAWPSLIGYLIALSGLIYFCVGLSVPYALWITVVLVILAHSASGANWVLSTVMMQRWVEDESRPRVFSGHADSLNRIFNLNQRSRLCHGKHRTGHTKRHSRVCQRNGALRIGVCGMEAG